MSQQEDFGWVRNQNARDEYPLLFPLLTSLILIGIGIAIGRILFADDASYSTNLYTEFLSISITVFVLNLFARQREERRRISDLQDQLIRNAASLSNEIAKDAVHQMRRRKWLRYGDTEQLLRGEDLQGAKLQDSSLDWADLRYAILAEANLRNVMLRGAHLEGADLRFADLSKANLCGAFLHEANLGDANLGNADLLETKLVKADLGSANLKGANLHGTILKGANLFNANLDDARFTNNTVLPDGTHWTPDTDLTRFTDSSHTNYWRAEGFMLRIILPQKPDS